MTRAIAIIILCLALGGLLGCSDHRGGLAAGRRRVRPVGHAACPVLGGGQSDAGRADLLADAVAKWFPGLGPSVSVNAAIICSSTISDQGALSPPSLGAEWDIGSSGGRFVINQINMGSGVCAVVYIRSSKQRAARVGPLLFTWSRSRWRICLPGWNQGDRQKLRLFVYLCLAGKLPSDVKELNGLLPGPMKILPTKIRLPIWAGPKAAPGK